MKNFPLLIRIPAAVATIAALFLAAGCGDEDSPADSASGNGSQGTSATEVKTGTLSKVQFIQRADTICQETRDRFEEELSKLFQEEGLKSAEGKVPQAEEEAKGEEVLETILVPVYEGQIKRIGSLGAPTGDEEEVQSFLDATQENLDRASAEPQQFISSEGQKFTEATQIARAYGLPGCAEAMDLSQGIVAE